MSRFLQIFCTILSALLIALAIPNEILFFGSPLIGLFALFPFYIALRFTRSLPETFLLCFIHGALTHLLSSFWLGNFMGYAIFTLGASDLGTGFFEGFFSLGFYAPVLFTKKTQVLEETAGIKSSFISFRALWFTAIYVIWEYCKSTGFLAYPWGTLSMTAYKWNSLTQIADITGVYGITFLFALFSATLGEGTLLLGQVTNSEAGKRRFTSYLQLSLLTLALFLISFTYGFARLSQKQVPVKTMNTILVQQNRNPSRRNENENIVKAQSLTQTQLDNFKAEGKNCDLVVWSEAVLSQRFPMGEVYYRHMPAENPLIPFIKQNQTPVIIGGPIVFNEEKREFGNSALHFDKDGNYAGAYTKMHLVPFAELIPFRNFEIIQKILKSMVGFSYGWTPGKEARTFTIPLQNGNEVCISTPICFDDSAHEVCRALYKNGSEIFVNITNDSWSKTKSAEIQHFVVAHYRSIEYRSTTVRSANAGYTVVIDSNGKVLADLPLFEEGALAYEVPIYERKTTVYALFGNWLPYTLIFLAFALLLVKIYKQRFEQIEVSLDFPEESV